MLVLLLLLAFGRAAAFSPHQVTTEARIAFEQILDLWRAEELERLYGRLADPAQKGWGYFAERMVYASRVPACCWEKLQEVSVSARNADHVVISARVGFEVEGVGTRFVTRDFHLQRIDGIWKLPMDDVLNLSAYNFQRIPRKIYQRTP
jgi:hypothetical protein